MIDVWHHGTYPYRGWKDPNWILALNNHAWNLARTRF